MNIEELKRRVRLEDVLHIIGAHLPSPSEGWRSMRCPFHEDRRASASLNRTLGRFRCHGCSARGDMLDLAGLYLGTTDRKVQKEWLEKTFIR